MTDYSGQQYLEHIRSALVALIPVGSISKEKFLKYAHHVAACKTFDLQEYVGFSSAGPPPTPTPGGFENRNWNTDVIYLRYDFVHTHSDWEELFLNQKASAVVGIADCSVERDLGTTFQLFTNLASRFKLSSSNSIIQEGVIPRCCLAFEMRSDQKDPDLTTFKVIPDQDFEHFNFYVSHIFGEEFVKPWLNQWENTVKTEPDVIAEKVFDSLYGASENLLNPASNHTALTTPLDADLPEEASRQRKRRLAGRVRKQQGDLCLFAGSPFDALNMYRQSLEISRSCSDWEWVGAALESSAAAIISSRGANVLKVNQNDIGLSTGDYQDIVFKLTEASSCYAKKKKACSLEVESLLRLARFYQVHEKKLEMSEVLQRCHELIDSMDTPEQQTTSFMSQLSSTLSGSPSSHHSNSIFKDPRQIMQEKIRLYSSLALIYRSSNYVRKYAFYVQLICKLCMATQDIPPSRSHYLLSQIAPEYEIDCNKLITTVQSKPPVGSRRQQLTQAGARWTKLQASILNSLVELSSSSGDIWQSIKYLVYMIREVVPHLNSDSHTEPSEFRSSRIDWGQKLRSLSAYVPPTLDISKNDPLMLGLGLTTHGTFLDNSVAEKSKALVYSATCFRPINDGAVYMHISRSVNDPLFLYRPNRKAKDAIAVSASHVFVWPGHTAYFDITLRNPFSHKINLEGCRLVLSPIVITPIDSQKTDIDWLPSVTVENDVTQPSAQITIDGNETISVKMSVLIPTITNLPDDHRAQVLLIVESFDYSLFSCSFSEPLTRRFKTPLKVLLLSGLHFLNDVPTVSIEDESHRWVSSTRAIRENGPTIISKSPSSASAIESESQSDSSSTAVSGKSTKSQHQLTVAISQLRGEVFSTNIILTNTSDRVVDDFGFLVYENNELITATRPAKVLVQDLASISAIISKSLPLLPNQKLVIPISFIASILGLVQVTFAFEYRNNRTKENMWRKLRIDYSFKVVEALKPLKLEISECLGQALEVLDAAMPHDVVILHSSPNPTEKHIQTSNEDTTYLLFQLSIQNKTMLSFQVLRGDQTFLASDSNEPHVAPEDVDSVTNMHTAFILDPWGIKKFSLAVHKQTFFEKLDNLVSEGVYESRQIALKSFVSKNLHLTWKAYANRRGSISFDENLVDDAVLMSLYPTRYTVLLEMCDAAGASIRKSGPNNNKYEYLLESNQIYNLKATVTCKSVGEKHALFSTVCTIRNLTNRPQSMSWIGKNQNIELNELQVGEAQVITMPMLFHYTGTYSLIANVRETGETHQYWSQEVCILVTK